MRNLPAGHNVRAEIFKLLGLIIAAVAGLSMAVAVAFNVLVAVTSGGASFDSVLRGPLWYGGVPLLLGLGLYLLGRFKSRAVRPPNV